VNRQQLKERLVVADVPESSYFIVGIDSQQTPGKGGGFGELVVAPAEDERGWRILTEERGRVQFERSFPTEDEACEAAWELLEPRNRPVAHLTAEQWAQAQSGSRDAVAEYEEAAARYREEHG
jgi:hypothetical protein